MNNDCIDTVVLAGFETGMLGLQERGAMSLSLTNLSTCIYNVSLRVSL